MLLPWNVKSDAPASKQLFTMQSVKTSIPTQERGNEDIMRDCIHESDERSQRGLWE